MEAIVAFDTRLTKCQPTIDTGGSAATALASAKIDPKLPSLTCQFL
jgi:hypothetical protein